MWFRLFNSKLNSLRIVLVKLEWFNSGHLKLFLSVTWIQFSLTSIISLTAGYKCVWNLDSLTLEGIFSMQKSEASFCCYLRKPVFQRPIWLCVCEHQCVCVSCTLAWTQAQNRNCYSPSPWPASLSLTHTHTHTRTHKQTCTHTQQRWITRFTRSK